MDHLNSYRKTGSYFLPVRTGQPVVLRHLSAMLLVSVTCCLFLLNPFTTNAQSVRSVIDINNNWKTIAGNDENPLPAAFHKNVDDSKWKQVNVPHNWDDYHGYRRLLHGNKHGDTWYRKKIGLRKSKAGKRFFLFFEGVGSYATVYLNDKEVGTHAGGRTSFTIDVTDQLKTDGSENILAVRAWHPPFIKDLPWVCGGCSDERGFSEGSQPMGIFRPVHLVITNEVRIEPFGVHAWAHVQAARSLLHADITLKNYGSTAKDITVRQELIDKKNKVVAQRVKNVQLKGGANVVAANRDLAVNNPARWSTEAPYLYKIKTTIQAGNKIIDEDIIDFGFRTVNWKTATNQFYLNEKPVFINGVAEYEHLIGQSHAFSHEQVVSRVKWLEAAGFNAFRDGHQPHNLLYGKLFNEKGILWWTQLSAHVWYDTPEFKENFKKLLTEWVIERRNDPSVVMWGLQNESKIPKAFAEECTQLIRSLDPTAATERLVTTCNGGEGTDWDVPQNWTGTYGGNPVTYGEDLKKQILVGEYGAWRTLDLHTEGGFVQNGPVSEDRFTQLMEKKVRLAESVKDSVAGHFFWLLTSHDNPGRVQGGEGLRELDRIGPVNYKGMLTPWEEPTDVYYMFRSNYLSAKESPMVYIASHTWPNRWMKPGIRDSVMIYSNCEEVELFNDIDNASLGRKKRGGVGTHFMWDNVNIRYNVLYAVGYIKGKAVARDTVVLFHLPEAPALQDIYKDAGLLKPKPGLHYIARVNCGGGEYKDSYGNLWNADRSAPASVAQAGPETADLKKHGFRFTSSWTKTFAGLPADFASQRRVFAPVTNIRDERLVQSFRYGKDQLTYSFFLPNGNYQVELYFIEPWIGVGGGLDGTGMRVFDVAFNSKIVLNDIDIWKEAGTHKLLKKTVTFTVTDQVLHIHFPESKAGQAIISAIAIATRDASVPQLKTQSSIAIPVEQSSTVQMQSWMDIGDRVFSDSKIQFNQLPPALFGAEWVRRERAHSGQLGFTIPFGADIYVGIDAKQELPQSIQDFENTNTEIVTDEDGGKRYRVYKKRFAPGSNVSWPQTENWLVAMNYATNMQPAYDLKATASYKSNVAVVTVGVEKKVVSGSERTVVVSSDEVAITWPVATGVADVYSITVKYNNPLEQDMAGTLTMFDVSGKIMAQQDVVFKLTNPGKWHYITINTGSMINAGNYQVRLLTKNAKGLIVSNIDIQ